MKSDPKSFWNMLNKLNKLSENSKEENLNEKEFIEFFEKNEHSIRPNPEQRIS